MSTGPEGKSAPIPFRRKFLYLLVIYGVFVIVLFGVEGVTRLTLPPLSSLDLFITTPEQRMQVATADQSGIFEGDPLLLWRLKPNLDHQLWDFTVVSTNAQGIRTDYPTRAKPTGTFRVVCLGDSVTFGYRVPSVWPERPTDYNPEWLPYPTLIEKQLRAANPNRKIEVFPMAVPGYTSSQGLLWLQRDIDMLKPDLLVVSFGWNDASFSATADRHTLKSSWLVVDLRWLIDHSQAFAHATQWLRKRSAEPAVPKPVSRVSEMEYVANFESIVRLANAKQARVIVMAAPYRDETTNPPEAKLMTSYRAALRENMQRDGVTYLEIPQLTEASSASNSLWFGELIHPNHMGHRLIASELLKLMTREKMLGDLNVPNFIP